MPEEHLAEVSALPEPGTTTESEEMYLITVARATEDGADGPVPIAVVAKDLQVSVASANEMIRKLAGRGMLTYEPYHGVELTESGAAIARRVLRTRRLWATFLAGHLGFDPKDADDQACLFEHVTIPEATDRLAEFLGDPEVGPLGKPIPRRGSGEAPPPTLELTDLPVGATGEVVSIDSSERAHHNFLAAEGVEPGARIKVIGSGDIAVLIELGGRQVHLDSEIARSVVVRRA